MKSCANITDLAELYQKQWNPEVPMSRKSKAAEFAQDVWDITVTGRNVQVTDAMKSYAIEKVSKIEKFSDRILDVQVIMDIQKLEHRCDIIIKVDHIKIKSHAVSDKMYSSIDMAVHKLEKQLLKYKRRIQEHQAKIPGEEEMLVDIIRAPTESEILDSINDEIEDENIRREAEKYRVPQIVNSEKRSLRMLSYDEAIMKLDLSGDAFVVFRHEQDQKVKVIYRRKDGDFGIIVPES